MCWRAIGCGWFNRSLARIIVLENTMTFYMFHQQHQGAVILFQFLLFLFHAYLFFRQVGNAKLLTFGTGYSMRERERDSERNRMGFDHDGTDSCGASNVDK